MFRNAYQNGMFTVFYSCGPKPLALWDISTKDGYINKFLDPEINTTVLEIGGTNISTTYMICPKGREVLGIKMPYLVMVVKNLKKYFSFEVTALDESNIRRRFRISNFQSTTKVMPLCTAMPMNLADGWNRVQFNIAKFMQRAYHKQFFEVHKLKINANVRIRRIYFADELLPENKLPVEYRLFFPLSSKSTKDSDTKEESKDKENVNPIIPAQAESQRGFDDLAALSTTLGLYQSPSLTNIRIKDSGYIPPLTEEYPDELSEDTMPEENIEASRKVDKLSTINESEEKAPATETPLTTSSQVDATANLEEETKHAEDLTAATEELAATDTNEVEITTEISPNTQTEVTTESNEEVSPEITTDVPADTAGTTA